MISIRRLFLQCLLLACSAGLAAADTPRILLVGDSWTALMWNARSFANALDDAGLGQWDERGAVTAIGGTTAAQWATQPFLNLITQELNAYPTVDIVHLSMGGNDLLGNPPANVAEADALLSQVAANVATVVAHIRSIRPAARIAWCGYDYVQGISSAELLTMMSQYPVDLAEATPNLYAINNWGLMQYYYGVPSVHDPLTLPFPGGYPDYAPALGGDPAYPSPPISRIDSIHLTPAGYEILAARCIDEFYAGWLGYVPGGVEIAVNDGSPVNLENGGRLELTAAVSGLTGPLAYQWRKDGEDIAGENTGVLVRDPASFTDSGDYSFFVSNGSGAKTLVESPPVNVTVGTEELPAMTFPKLMALAALTLVYGGLRIARRAARPGNS